VSKANAIFRRVGDDLEMLSEYLELHEDDFEPMTNGFLQSLAENMQKQLTRIENTWNECREVER
jgi:hypothetical protein